jgi:hypothetical protein
MILRVNNSLENKMDTKTYLGLSKTEANNKAKENNLIFLLIRVDDRDIQKYPFDLRKDRICVEIEDGAVIKATIQ